MITTILLSLYQRQVNKWYECIQKTYAAKITPNHVVPIPQSNQNLVAESKYMYPTGENKIKTIIKSLKTKAAPGTDGLSTKATSR